MNVELSETEHNWLKHLLQRKTHSCKWVLEEKPDNPKAIERAQQSLTVATSILKKV